MDNYEVIVVGSGAAGLCAALEASAAGANVLLVEGEAIVGGSSRLSGGIIMAADSSFQRAAGYADSVETAFQHYMALNQWKVEPAAVRRLIEDSAGCIDWLVGLGVHYQESPVFAGEELVPRALVPVEGAGLHVVDTLHKRVKERRNIDIALGRRINRLVVDDETVVGVAVDDDEVRASAVVLATGGFGANPDLLRRYYPAVSKDNDWLWYIGAAGSRGDAFAFGAQVDAQVTGFDRGQTSLRANFNREKEVYFPGWLIIVDANGRRFFDETAPYSVTEVLVRAAAKPVYAIFDDAAKRAATFESAGASKKNDLPTDQLVYDWVEDNIDRMVSKGRVLVGQSVAELAAKIEVDGASLQGTIDAYNEGVDRGHDSVYLKSPALMSPITTAPFYATELRLAQLGVTATGLRINHHAQVVNAHSSPVGGLFAAGECTGGIIGDVYMGSGNSWINCVVFGRIAGRNAAATR